MLAVGRFHKANGVCVCIYMCVCVSLCVFERIARKLRVVLSSCRSTSSWPQPSCNELLLLDVRYRSFIGVLTMEVVVDH